MGAGRSAGRSGWRAVAMLVATAAMLRPGAAAAQADAWWLHVTRLADDSMRGRETGSPEHRKAAEYIASQFRRLGLKPAGSNGYFQQVPLIVRRVDESRARAVLVRDGAEQPLHLGEDALFAIRTSGEGEVDAPLVFAGFGISVPEQGYDDLAGLDVRGKVVVVLGGGVPKGVSGPALASARQASAERLRAAGAVGMVTIANPRGDVPWARQALARLNPQMVLDDATPQRPATFASLTVNAERAELLFAGAAQRYAEVQALADSGAPLPRLVLPSRLRASVAFSTTHITSDNVAAVLPGADKALRDQYLVVTAHLDHVGVGGAIDGDSIYNGAMDNASGVATLIETAKALTARRPGPRRSVLFLAVTGEEKGLLGSLWYARHPTVRAQAVVADLNTDMFLPINPLDRLIVNGLEESDLADDVRRAASRHAVEVVSDPEPERNAFVRSDQYSFIREGIPALSLKVGFVRGSPEHERVLRWRQERYHGPKDDLLQPINRVTAERFNALYADLIGEVADRAARPAWYPTSIFRPKPATP